MSLTFHESFPLECENIAKLLAVVADKPTASNVEIAELTGIGIGVDPRKGKVQPTIAYAMCGGMLTEERGMGGRQITLTEVGRLVLQRDPELKRPVTHWVLHYHLSRKGGEAETWAYFTHEFLPGHPTFDRATFEQGVVTRFGDRATLRSIKPGLVLSCYTENRSLSSLRWLREASRQYQQAQPYFPTPYLIGYVLAEIWNAQHPTRMMIDVAALAAPGHLSTSTGLQDAGLQEQLNALTHLGVIRQMREAPPYQVVKQWDDKLSLLANAYEEGR